MKSNLFTVIFAIILGLACSFLLTAVAESIKPLRQTNEKAERHSNVLKIFDISIPQGAANQDIIEIFEEEVIIVGDDPANPESVIMLEAWLTNGLTANNT